MIDNHTRAAIVAELRSIASVLISSGWSDAAHFLTLRADAIGGQTVEVSSPITLDKPTEFPAWTGTNASAAQLAGLIREVDRFATVESEGPLTFQGDVVVIIDTVPNTIRLRKGDRPAFDGTQWSVVAPGVKS